MVGSQIHDFVNCIIICSSSKVWGTILSERPEVNIDRATTKRRMSADWPASATLPRKSQGLSDTGFVGLDEYKPSHVLTANAFLVWP